MKCKEMAFPLFALALLATTTAHAELYLGASVGHAEIKDDAPGQGSAAFSSLGFSNVSTNFDKRDTGVRAFGGYFVTKSLGVEVAYVNLGRFRLHTEALSSNVGAGFLDTEARIEGADISVVGRWPIGDKFSLFGRAGVFLADTETNVTAGGSVELFSGNVATYKDRSTAGTFAIGTSYRLTKAISLRAEISRFNKLKVKGTLGSQSDTSINLFSAGVSYQF